MIKNILTGILALSITTVPINFNNPETYFDTIDYKSQPQVEKEYLNDDGELIQNFNDNTQVIFNSDDTITIYSPFGPELSDDTIQSKVGWIAIGKAVVKIVSGTIGFCSGTEYVTGHDVCRIVKRYISRPTKTKYNVNGIYRPEYIPGCQPQHSGPCNSGYWEYRVY